MVELVREWKIALFGRGLLLPWQVPIARHWHDLSIEHKCVA